MTEPKLLFIRFPLQRPNRNSVKRNREELLRLKLGNSVTGGAIRRELEKASAVVLQKIGVSNKGDSLIKHKREQKSSHNFTGPHNSIPRMKKKIFLGSLFLQIVCHFCLRIVLR